jgi:hypothetical protein
MERLLLAACRLKVDKLAVTLLTRSRRQSLGCSLLLNVDALEVHAGHRVVCVHLDACLTSRTTDDTDRTLRNRLRTNLTIDLRREAADGAERYVADLTWMTTG